MDSFIDNLLDSHGGSVTYLDVCAAVIVDVQLEICNPDVAAFQTLLQMTGNEIARFGPLRPSPLGVPHLHPDSYSNYPSDKDSATGREEPCLCASPKYYHRFGEYET